MNKVKETLRVAFAPYAALKPWARLPGAVAVASWLAAENIPASRDLSPAYFQHVGNTAFGFISAVQGAHLVASVMAMRYPHGSREAKGRVAATAGLLAGSATAFLIENPAVTSLLSKIPGLAEHIGLTPDPKDMLFGLAGAALGAYGVSMARVEDQRARAEASALDWNFIASGQLAAAMARAS